MGVGALVYTFYTLLRHQLELAHHQLELARHQLELAHIGRRPQVAQLAGGGPTQTPIVAQGPPTNEGLANTPELDRALVHACDLLAVSDACKYNYNLASTVAFH